MSALGAVSLPDIDFRRIADDFRGLDLKDVTGWPLVPRVVFLVALLLTILAGGWWFDWREQLDTLDGKRQQEEKLKEEFLLKKRQAVNLDEYRKQLAEIDRSFGALLRQLPNRSEMESLLIDINQAGLGRGLQFELFKPGTENTRDFYAELPVSVRVSGSYHDFGAFAGDVAKLTRIVALKDVAVEAAQSGGLRMDAVATTYRYLDDEEMARQKREQQAKARAAGR
ncbi:MAG: type 4a pilus biogenesis protein PilO [Betaproteobacteria bacterium]|nr:type 4a pilus biogenesis protein PilO [Betaproteobacteria bacterium]